MEGMVPYHPLIVKSTGEHVATSPSMVGGREGVMKIIDAPIHLTNHFC